MARVERNVLMARAVPGMVRTGRGTARTGPAMAVTVRVTAATVPKGVREAPGTVRTSLTTAVTAHVTTMTGRALVATVPATIMTVPRGAIAAPGTERTGPDSVRIDLSVMARAVPDTERDVLPTVPETTKGVDSQSPLPGNPPARVALISPILTRPESTRCFPGSPRLTIRLSLITTLSPHLSRRRSASTSS